MTGAQTVVPFNDLTRLYSRFAPEIETAVVNILSSGWWISGKSGKSFSSEFAAFVGSRHCIPVANGTDALEIALKAVARGTAGREIVTVANAGGYASTAARLSGFVPVFADINRDCLLMSIDSAVSRLGRQTAAVVATHLFGNVVDIPALRKAMDAKGYSNVPIVEDCSQAHGATQAGHPVGSLGEIATFSFYPTKNLGAAGDAGAIVTNSSDLAAIAGCLKQYGWSEKYKISMDGGRNSRMDELQAAILSVLLRHLPQLNAERAEIRDYYKSRLSDGVALPVNAEGAVAHLLPVMTERRDALREFMLEKGIRTEIHFPILDCDQPAWSDLEKPELGNSRWAVDRVLSIPCFIGMTRREQDAVCDAVNEFFSQ